jgi:hypothetical protein
LQDLPGLRRELKDKRWPREFLLDSVVQGVFRLVIAQAHDCTEILALVQDL